MKTVLFKFGKYWKNNLHIAKNRTCKGFVRLIFEKGSINNEVIIKDNTQLHNLKVRFTGSNSKLHIGSNVKWKGYILIHGNNREVVIGDNSTCIKTFLMCRDANIYIGKNCMISREVEIRSSDVHKIYDKVTHEQINKPSDTKIGDNVWIAAKTVISKGSLVPNGSVVGAMSFVNKKFYEENILIAGAPAKQLKEGVYWQR